MESEFDLIAALVERLPPPGPRVRVGSGDDAAVTEPRAGASVTSVDALTDGVHFELERFGARAVGRKALAAALSDLAAMGAEPGEAYVALGVPEGMPKATLLELAEGLAEVARREHVSVIGGDLTRAPALTLAITCVGYEPREGRLVTRGGARPGDALAVTGELGGAPAGLIAIEREEPGPHIDGEGVLDRGADPVAGRVRDARPDPVVGDPVVGRQLDPRPRLAAGRALAAAGATAMIDISDGLGADAGHLAARSGVRIEIEAERVPLAPGLVELMGDRERALPLALSGGEDYELLAAIPAAALAQAREELGPELGLTEIGRVLEGAGAVVLGADGSQLQAGGFDHMRGSRSGAGSAGPGSGEPPDPA